MIRTLLATTAVAAVLATGALAQDASSAMPMDASSAPMDTSSMPMDTSSAPVDSSMMSDAMSSATSMDSSMMSDAAPMAAPESSMMDETMSSAAPMDTDTTAMSGTRTPVVIAQGYTQVDTDRLATKIIGSPVYSSAATDADNFGNITDIVLGEDGQVSAVVLGVGGFLGIGQKQVAIDFSALQWTTAADNTERFVLATTKDELTSAPDFTTVDDQPAAPPADATTMSSSATM